MPRTSVVVRMDLRTYLFAALGVGVLAGCEIPTSAPILQQRWVLAGDNTTIAVDEFLPAGVAISGANFDVSVDPLSVTQTVGDVCPACVALDGLTTPSPGFTANFTTAQMLPSGISSAAVSSGSIDLAIQNGLPLDPIRVGASTGTFAITITNGAGETVGQLSLNGATDSIPVASTEYHSIQLIPGSTISSPLSVVTAIVSPSGGSLLWDASGALQVTATPNSVLVNSATVDASGLSVDLDDVDLDVSSLEPDMVELVQSGAFALEITNPFGIGLDASVTISGPTFATITKDVSVSSTATSVARVEFTGVELQTFLGQAGVLFSGSGAVSGATNITVSPGQEIEIEASIDLTIQIG